MKLTPYTRNLIFKVAQVAFNHGFDVGTANEPSPYSEKTLEARKKLEAHLERLLSEPRAKDEA
jgi:hypothetical protein